MFNFEFLFNICIEIASGLLALSISYPLDVIRVRMAADIGQKQEFKGFIDCFTKITQKQGFQGLYWGIGAGALGLAAFRISHDVTL